MIDESYRCVICVLSEMQLTVTKPILIFPRAYVKIYFPTKTLTFSNIYKFQRNVVNCSAESLTILDSDATKIQEAMFMNGREKPALRKFARKFSSR